MTAPRSCRAVFSLETGEPIGARETFMRFDQRDLLLDRFRNAGGTEEREAIARSLRQLDAPRLDAAVCDERNGVCPCEVCEVERLDGGDVVGLSLVKAGKWLGAERVRQIREDERDPTERRVMVETLIEAARSIGEASAEQIAAIRGASLDDLRTAYSQLPDPEPPTERTDTMSDIESQARANMNKAAHTAWTRPLSGGRPGDPEPTATADDRARLDSAERQYNRRVAECTAFQKREESTVRVDGRSPFTVDPNLKEKDGAVEEVDPEAKARRRAQHRAENQWRRPLNKADAQQLEILELANEEA